LLRGADDAEHFVEYVLTDQESSVTVVTVVSASQRTSATGVSTQSLARLVPAGIGLKTCHSAVPPRSAAAQAETTAASVCGGEG